MAGVSGTAALKGEPVRQPRGFERQERGKRRPFMYIGIGGLILLIILLVILF